MIANKKQECLPCPECGEDWLYGWEKPSLLKDFLSGLKQWCCVNCKKVFNVVPSQEREEQ